LRDEIAQKKKKEKREEKEELVGSGRGG